MNITPSSSTNAAKQSASSSNVKRKDDFVDTEIRGILINKAGNVKLDKKEEVAEIEAKISEKTEKLDQLLSKITTKEYVNGERREIAKEKHPIAHLGANICQSVAIGGAAWLLGGLCSGNAVFAMVSGVGMAIGGLAGIGFGVYFDYKEHQISDEEIRNVYTQKANELAAEIKLLKQELRTLM